MSKASVGCAGPRLAAMLALGLAATTLGGCVVFREPIATAQTQPVPTAPCYPAQPGTAFAAGAGATVPPPPTLAPPVAPAPTNRQFHLGAAASALVSQAHRQEAGGDPQLAISTIERALRIEPDNPLLWIELGAVHEAAGRYEQAGGMGHKALQLATGDPHAQAASWHLIADSLKARGRNGEASEAQRRADELAPQ
jgi:Tetratricopeptide repeat